MTGFYGGVYVQNNFTAIIPGYSILSIYTCIISFCKEQCQTPFQQSNKVRFLAYGAFLVAYQVLEEALYEDLLFNNHTRYLNAWFRNLGIIIIIFIFNSNINSITWILSRRFTSSMRIFALPIILIMDLHYLL